MFRLDGVNENVSENVNENEGMNENVNENEGVNETKVWMKMKNQECHLGCVWPEQIGG